MDNTVLIVGLFSMLFSGLITTICVCVELRKRIIQLEKIVGIINNDH